jgi:membrane fusion protein (multidrug efflux system)
MALVSLLAVGACDQAEEQVAAPPPPAAVSVVVVPMADVSPAAEFVGRVVAVDKVELRARVQGFLEKRAFTEGQEVREDELLFVIEQAPFQAAVIQAEADLTSAKADAKNAAVQLDRAEQLLKKQNIPAATRDDRAATAAVANAAVKDREAALEVAKINLGYTEIRAPVTGRIGLATFSEGNLVGPESGVLAVIVSQDPIFVTFQVSQRDLLEARRRQQAAGIDTSALVVRLKLPDGSEYAHSGKVNFLDVQIAQGTDTATVRAVFDNPDRMLIDGALVDVSVERGTPTPTLVIPQAAIQVDQAGPFALVVNDGNKVEVRRLTLGRAVGVNMAVAAGLQEGELVIVEGIQKVRPGAEVAPTTVPMPSGESVPAASAG